MAGEKRFWWPGASCDCFVAGKKPSPSLLHGETFPLVPRSRGEVGSVVAPVLQPHRDGAAQLSMAEQAASIAVSSKPVRQPEQCSGSIQPKI